MHEHLSLTRFLITVRGLSGTSTPIAEPQVVGRANSLLKIAAVPFWECTDAAGVPAKS